jgi:hypothetical protein
MYFRKSDENNSYGTERNEHIVPLTGCSNEEKEEFEEILEDNASGEHISIMGDFNA